MRGKHFASRTTTFVLLCILAASPATARADSRESCVEAAERSQTLRSAGKLGEARAALTACSRADCPAVVRRDCAQWMADVLAAQPTVVFAARDERGRDVLAVRVVLDGSVVTTSLDGRAMPVDPGKHVVRMEAGGYAAIEETVLVREGDKERQLVWTLSPTSKAPEGPRATPAAPAAAHADNPATEAPGRPVPVTAYVAGAVGVAALGVAAIFDVRGTLGALELKDSCGSRCAASDVDPLRTDYRIAQVSAGIGIVALGAALILYLTR